MMYYTYASSGTAISNIDYYQTYYQYQTPVTASYQGNGQGCQSYYQQIGYGNMTTGNTVTAVTEWVETDEQRVVREKRDLEYKIARERARATLVSILSKEQREQFETDKHFELKVNDRLYRVRPGSRVERLEPATKKILSYFCIHPPSEYGLPSEDVAIGQKLLLETDESAFLRIANETKVA